MKFRKIQPKWIIRLISVILVITVTILWAQFNPALMTKIKRKIIPPAMVPLKSYFLELRTEHYQCNHHDIEQKMFASEQLLNETLSEESGYQYRKKIKSKYFYSRQGSGLCESCSKNQYLGISDGKVAVFRGTPDKSGPIVETTEIRTELLPQVELDDLKRGIQFADDKEKLQLLEGLDGLILN